MLDPQGLRLIFRGEFDGRQLLRDSRACAQRTGAGGWARPRSDGTSEIVVYRPDGLHDFMRRMETWTEAPEISVEISESGDAAALKRFRIRREQFILQRPGDVEYYDSLGVD